MLRRKPQAERCLLGALGTLILVSPGAMAAEYVIRADQSELVVLVFKTGFAAALAHDHVVRATRVAGSISGDPTNPATTVVRVTVAAETLAADEPDMRKKHGLAAVLGDADRREIQATMLGETQLHVAAYPDITFRSVSVEPRPPAGFLVTGDFTLRGTTRRLSVPVTAELAGDTLRATRRLRLQPERLRHHPGLPLPRCRPQPGPRARPLRPRGHALTDCSPVISVGRSVGVGHRARVRMACGCPGL